MRFIADENVARLVIHHLRGIGYNVVSIVEVGLASTDDNNIIDMGLRERRIIITHDKDFGHVLHYPLKEHNDQVHYRCR
jgi:predicted nuclease of predicted toxin-antitoxin system